VFDSGTNLRLEGVRHVSFYTASPHAGRVKLGERRSVHLFQQRSRGSLGEPLRRIEHTR